MPTINHPEVQPSCEGAPWGEFAMSAPDAERLLLQSRFVRNRVEAEIYNNLEACIRKARLLDPSEVPPDLVTMNSQILLRDVENAREFVFTLAFPSRANAKKGRISILTPLGSVLLGARKGQRLTCPIDNTVSTVVVESILHQPEASGDYRG
jgi:regulator of nucleoside diphosphate kinase